MDIGAQDRQNELLEELINQLGSAQRQRGAELNQWKQANPELARYCRTAAESLSRVQVEFLHSMTREINEGTVAMAANPVSVRVMTSFSLNSPNSDPP